MRPATHIFLATFAVSASSCGLSYQQRQDRFREQYMTGCQVLHRAPVDPNANIATADLPQQSEVSEVIERSRSELDRCYLEALAIWPQLEGRVVLNLTIDPSGTVSNTAVAMHNSTVFDPTVGCCLARVAQTWRFPVQPDAKLRAFEYPFELVTDFLKVRLSSSVVTADNFKSPFPATVLTAPPQPASGTEIHHTW